MSSVPAPERVRESSPTGFFRREAAWFYIFAGVFTLGAPLAVPHMNATMWLIWLLAAASLLVLLAPVAFIKDYDLFQPISFVALSVAIGVPLRTLYIFALEDPARRYFFLRGFGNEFLLAPTLLMLFAMISLVAGYFFRPSVRRIVNVDRLLAGLDRPWKPLRTFLIIVFLALLSAIGLYIFIRVLNIVNVLDNLSAKRVAKVDGAVTSLGYLRLMMRTGLFGYLIAFVWFAFSGKRWASAAGAGVIVMAIWAAFPPFFNSARTELMAVPLLSLVIWNYARRQLTVKDIAVAGLAGVMVIAFMGALRADKNEDLGAAVANTFSGDVYESLVDNLNFLGTPTTAQVMEAVPERLPWAYGETLFRWVLAPIPRSKWPNKPDITLGTTIAEQVYLKRGTVGGQIPPNIVSELYWNFGVLGVVAGMFALGNLMRWIYLTFLPHIRRVPMALLLYLFIVFPVSFYIPNNSVPQGVLQTLLGALPMVLLVPAVLGLRRRRASA